jgi:hypothetical protein
VATTTATGAGIGAIAGGGKAQELARIGGLISLGAILLTRAGSRVASGSTLDVVIERDLV